MVRLNKPLRGRLIHVENDCTREFDFKNKKDSIYIHTHEKMRFIVFGRYWVTLLSLWPDSSI